MSGKAVFVASVVAAVQVASPTRLPHVPYLEDAAFRREALMVSLVNQDNRYSRLRVEHYATNDSRDWERLPEWNPPTQLVSEGEFDRPGRSTAFETLHLPPAETITSETDPALVALGKAAFSRYPTQLAPELTVALASREAAARYGLWIDRGRGVGGLVRARLADGSIAVALTCSSCHAAPGRTGIDDGLSNTSLDVGAAILASSPAPTESRRARAIAGWGPGRLDVSTESGTEPVQIPDLRPVHFLTYLQRDATVAVHGLSSLAIRIETLVITSYGQVVRPPRLIALALAAYVDSLANTLPSASTAGAASPRGQRIVLRACRSCHAPPDFTGAPVRIESVATDPVLGLSGERGTGFYRVPSLRGVGSRNRLLHDGVVPSLDALFDPSRPSAEFAARLHGQGAVPGHLFGLELPRDDREALIDFLRAL